ncbi:TrkA C-terminal domain-containing protein [uncultured Veillonella sp.]|uniref:TrkA C-terminal domain-containing protein n=1 Tax=uncultured Veillonella sp. TaxID=159268 RepID=UPI00261CBA54|nr:TrkA C-terminal domain-containing protein [uncultured Veillonella sp.]
MSKPKSIKTARYLQIAADVAGKIVSGGYEEGEKIFARSALSVHYGVSPVTSRRAIALLADLGIVAVTKGSGCTVLSKEKAEQFRMQFNDFDSVDSLHKDVIQQIDAQIEGFKELKDTVSKLNQLVSQYQYTNPLQPMKMAIKENCKYLDQSIGSLQLWQHTGITVVAIEGKDKAMTISPGPYATLKAGEEIYFVGPMESWARLKHYLYGDE